MYFWKTEKLAEEIKNKTLSDNSWLWYFLIWGVLTSLTSYLPASEDSMYPIIDIIGMLVLLTIGIVGTIITFKTNLKGGSAENYFSRVIALGLPISIKLLSLLVPIFIILTIILYIALGINEGNVEIFDNLYSPIIGSLLGISIEIGFFWRTNVHLKYINS